MITGIVLVAVALACALLALLALRDDRGDLQMVGWLLLAVAIWTGLMGVVRIHDFEGPPPAAAKAGVR